MLQSIIQLPLNGLAPLVVEQLLPRYWGFIKYTYEFKDLF